MSAWLSHNPRENGGYWPCPLHDGHDGLFFVISFLIQHGYGGRLNSIENGKIQAASDSKPQTLGFEPEPCKDLARSHDLTCAPEVEIFRQGEFQVSLM